MSDITQEKISTSFGTFKVLEKLFHMQCDIGTQGTVDCYLVETFDTNPIQKIVAIFIGTHEEVAFDLIGSAPECKEDVQDILDSIQYRLEQVYIAASMHEKSRHEYIH